jgi:hypothetical protein
MRYHVPRDGFVWHSDISTRKRRWPLVVGVLALGGACFSAGLLAAGVSGPAHTPSVAAVSAAVAETPPPAPVRISATPSTAPPIPEKGVSVADTPKRRAAPAPSTEVSSVKILNPDADNDDEPDAVEAPKPRVRPAPQTEPKRTVRSRPPAAEMPYASPPPAPKGRGIWGETGPSGYSALRESVFDR